jgi:molecular chaperone DnaK (HSP70)
MILQKMKKTAEDYLGQEVTEAVITVPAYLTILNVKQQKKQEKLLVWM